MANLEQFLGLYGLSTDSDVGILEFSASEFSGNAHGGSGGYIATAESALNGWQNGPPHNAVILNQGQWADLDWGALGVGICKFKHPLKTVQPTRKQEFQRFPVKAS